MMVGDLKVWKYPLSISPLLSWIPCPLSLSSLSLLLWPIFHISYKCYWCPSITFRDKANFIIFTCPKMPQNTFGDLNTSFNNEWISANLMMLKTTHNTFQNFFWNFELNVWTSWRISWKLVKLTILGELGQTL